MPQFDATIKHLKEGIKGFTIAAAIKNIEGWEAVLEKSEVAGAKTIHGNLEKLKKLLQAEEIDGGKVKDLVMKLADETVRIAGKMDSKDADKVKSLGEALSHATEGAEKDDKKHAEKDDKKVAEKDDKKHAEKDDKKTAEKHAEKDDKKHAEKDDKKHAEKDDKKK